MLVDNKNGIDDSNFNNRAVFHFSIDGKGDYAVAAGHCSMPIIVNAGSHTVLENLAKSQVFGSEHPTGQTVPLGFAFVSSTATGPTGDNRATSGTANNGGNPITVNVPYFSDPVNGGETLVTFTNRVLRFQIKVCKVVESGSVTPLLPYDGTYGGTVSSRTDGSAPWSRLSNGQCTGLLSNSNQPTGWQVIDDDGDFTTATLVETSSGPYFISAATVDNTWPGQGGTTITGTPARTVTWHPGIGVNVITITNKYARSGVSNTALTKGTTTRHDTPGGPRASGALVLRDDATPVGRSWDARRLQGTGRRTRRG